MKIRFNPKISFPSFYYYPPLINLRTRHPHFTMSFFSLSFFLFFLLLMYEREGASYSRFLPKGIWGICKWSIAFHLIDRSSISRRYWSSERKKHLSPLPWKTPLSRSIGRVMRFVYGGSLIRRDGNLFKHIPYLYAPAPPTVIDINN